MARQVPNEILDTLRSKVGDGNLVRSCSGEGCRVYMTDVPSARVVVNAHKALPAHGIRGERCDRVLFLVVGTVARLVAVPIELKSGTVDVSKVAEQLRRGVEFVDRLVPETVDPLCRPLLVHGDRIHPKQRTMLNRAKIRFRGRDLTITTTRCGRRRNLADVLPKAKET